MKFIQGRDFTQQAMEEMCNTLQHNSLLRISPADSGRQDKSSGDLVRLIQSGLINEESHLQQGILAIDYSNEFVNIYEIPLQYPDGRLIKAIDEGKENSTLLGPLTGVFAHVFNNGMYAVHVRGNGIAAPGKIQIVAGMGHYGIYPADKALKEIKEELDIINAELTLNRNRFLDVTPFMKSGKFSQPLFSYIATADLSSITTVIKNNEELEGFIKKMPEERLKEAYPFLVPMENLRQFLDEIDKKGKFYGPVKRTAYNFLYWFNQSYGKNY
jgi:hypothetical protein